MPLPQRPQQLDHRFRRVLLERAFSSVLTEANIQLAAARWSTAAASR
ncbi:hypothetical protein CU044_4976 [Streptomyces sp. L-9-10]|nr:hypothetical protein CU044_4976 [Streptomyces sp. L-9-10]